MGNWILRWIGLGTEEEEEEEDGATSSTTTGQTTSAPERVPASDPASESIRSDVVAVEDTFMKMKCDELAEALSKILDDKSYEKDLEKLKDGNIDGKLFLTLLDNPDLLMKLGLSVGGEAKMKEIIQGIQNGSLKFGQADCSRQLVEPDMPWCSTQSPVDMPNGSGKGAAASGGGIHKAVLPSDTDSEATGGNTTGDVIEQPKTDEGGEATGGNTAGGVIEQPKTDEGDTKPKSGPPGSRTRTDAGDITDSTTGTDAESTSDSVGAPKQKKQNEVESKQEYDVEVTNAYLGRMEWVEDGKTEVVRIYDKSVNKWRVIGDSLGIDESFLESIEGSPPDSRIRKVLGKWQENACQLSHPDQYPKSWRGLLNLLKDSDLPELAKNVHKALLQLEQKSPSKTNQMAGGPPALVNGQNGGQAGSDMAGAAPVPPSPLVQPVNGQQSQGRLHIDDLNSVKNDLWKIRVEWRNIGEALGVEPGSIEAADQKCKNPGDCLRDIISTWLRGAETPEKPITWASLASALEQDALKEKCGAIAADIRRNH